MSKTYNGGITLKLEKGTADITIDTVQNYSVDWQTEKESFERYDFSTCTVYKGDRFVASITTGLLTIEEMRTLRQFLLTKREFTMYCPEYPETGDGIEVRLTSLSQPLEVANYGRRYYRVSFAVAAVALMNGGSL